MAVSRSTNQLQDFLETDFLPEQVDSIKQMADWISVLTRMQSDPLGWTIFDQEIFDGRRP